MDSNDKIYECANSYTRLMDYEYKLSLYNNGTVINTTICFDDSGFMHLAGLEKLTDLTLFSDISSSRLYNNIMNNNITYQDACSSSLWNIPLNDPQTNNVTYTLEDRIETLTNLRDILNNCSAKAYSWNPDCHNSYRPYSSEIKADFMLVFESENPKTSDERIYAFFKLDKNNPEISYGVSQFPTDRTYNNDGRRSVPEITIMSLIEHDKVNNVDRIITEISSDERQRLTSNALLRSVNSVVAKDLRQLKSKRYKYVESKTEAARKAYERKLDIFGSKTPYTNQMLKEAAERLTAQAQDPHNSNVKDLITNEIKLIKSELASREKAQNSQLSSGIQIAKIISNNDGTISMTKPIATIKTPQVVNKAESAIKRAAHFISVNAADIVSNIKDKLKSAFSEPNNKAPERKPTKNKSVKPKSRAVQSGKKLCLLIITVIKAEKI